MPHKFDPERMERLLGPERRQMLDPDEVLDVLPLQPGHVVADIGCGPGYFTVPLARRVPNGKVYAFDVQDKMIKAAKERVGAEGVTNVEVLLSGETSIPLPPNSLDGVFMAFVLHEVDSSKADFLSMLKRHVRPEGWLGIVEWKKVEMEEGPPLEERLSPREVSRFAKAAGFAPGTHRSLNRLHYMVISRCLPNG